MHYSRMRTACSSTRPGGALPRGVSLPGRGCLLPRGLPAGGSFCGVSLWGFSLLQGLLPRGLPARGSPCGGLLPRGSPCWGPSRGPPSRGVGVSFWGVFPAGVSLPGASFQGVSLPGGPPSLGVSFPGGASFRGVSLTGGASFGGRGPPSGGDLLGAPPVDRITEACENITLPQLRCGR